MAFFAVETLFAIETLFAVETLFGDEIFGVAFQYGGEPIGREM